MTLGGRLYSFVLLLGDIIFFIFALWLTLALRYWQPVSRELFWQHLVPFSLIFLLSALVYFIYDLYRRQTLVFESALAGRIIQAQIFNSVLAVSLFYFIPFFSQTGVTPKTNLFAYLIISSGLILLWRRYLAQFIYQTGRATMHFDCFGLEVEELKQEFSKHPNHQITLSEKNPEVVVINRYEQVDDSRLSDLYRALFRGVQFVSVQDLYEEIFGRIPLSLVNERWFLEQVSARPSFFYDLFKRLMDLIVALILSLVSLLVYPFIVLAIKLEDGGPILYYDRRVGRYGGEIKIAKFRTMSLELDLADRHATRVGKFLRRSRLDELPQLWSVVAGRQSLIGPRPEKQEYVELYRERIPFYDARHLIAPGLSGWAQIYHENHPHFSLAEDATREKLSYDLYYVKNRSLWLDITIALKTIKTILSRSGK
jgi:lipopolysaccharide/colanic/teichoic acid biosynthesis glycosyltransferase